MAAAFGAMESAQLLLQFGADPLAEVCERISPLDLAEEFDEQQVIQLFKKVLNQKHKLH